MNGPHLECLPDECVAKMLGHSPKKITHHRGKNRVCRYMESNTNVLGMVDEDPNSTQHSYLKSLEQISILHNVRVLEDKKTGNRLVVLCPKLEDWLIGVCKANKVNMEMFGLSDWPNTLHREINGKLKNLEKLLDHLMKIKSQGILHLKSVLVR